ncbi:MAG: hypothetical protein IBJ10_11520 [Phycisphaerales bacterium]|nr:hypothetical protein [Phycisphaerales bacterium]
MSNSKRRRAAIATLPARLLMAAGCARALSGAAFATDFAWTSPVSGNFSNVGLWTPMGAPSGTGDTALIGLAGAYTVTIDAHLAIGSLTLDALGATLAATGRTIDMQDLFTLSQGTVAFTSSTLVGAGSLRVDGGAFLARGASAFNSAAENNGLFWVNGVNGAGHATLTLNSAFTNGGTLRMESQNISWNSNIAMGAGQFSRSRRRRAIWMC